MREKYIYICYGSKNLLKICFRQNFKVKSKCHSTNFQMFLNINLKPNSEINDNLITLRFEAEVMRF